MGRTIVVKPTELLVHGVHFGDVDSDATKVEVIVKRGTIEFVAGGKPVTIKEPK